MKTVTKVPFLQYPASGLITVDEGKEAIVECRAFGVPDSDETKFSWRREGFKFSSNGGHTFEGERYEIKNASREDAGFYFCTADSDKGNYRNLQWSSLKSS